MRKTLLAALLLACGVAHRANSDDFDTAAEVASWCQPYKTAVEKDGYVSVTATAESQVCFGAFLAIQQLSPMTVSGKPSPYLRTCIPENVRLVELIKVFMRYVEERPQVGHRKFADVVLLSLWDAYPCPAGGDKSPPPK
jgi:hypothetical protein